MLRYGAILLSLGLLGASTVRAQSAPRPDAGTKTVDHVYTNADLERLGPVPGTAKPVVQGGDLGWDFVADFLEREYARLDADRNFELEQRRIEVEEQVAARRHGVRGLPYHYAGFYGSSFQPRRAHHDPARTNRPGPMAWRITPLHARPRPAREHRHRVVSAPARAQVRNR